MASTTNIFSLILYFVIIAVITYCGYKYSYKLKMKPEVGAVLGFGFSSLFCYGAYEHFKENKMKNELAKQPKYRNLSMELPKWN